MVSALDSGLSRPGSGPGGGHCVVFLGKTLYSLSLHIFYYILLFVHIFSVVVHYLLLFLYGFHVKKLCNL